ncbi:cation diffusion facilitator family transporter [Secundilactobacillus malefermentans]|uniref:cation diffusion facilitator family transporter n=1 Tax=Secundilactobacillus malefermentans TaxID=176292 RepID=UPI0011C9C641|nr:cation diffusion facilitator family transporter [Secundilactobacillus malefermentans]QEA31027.1 cation transporter [Secundilactobacillus malefermentans]
MHDALSGKRFFGVTVLNVCITVLEIIGGLLSGSLALLSDAFHNLGDSLSIVISYIAHKISKKSQDSQNTFGYRRAQILAALLNAALLVFISLFLIAEAVKRFSEPETIDGTLMLIVAIVGIVANLISVILLSRGSHHNMNIKATYLHMMSDTLSSVGVILGAVLIKFYGITIIDPIVTILVAIYIMFECWPIIKQAINILMEGAPSLDYEAIRRDLIQIEGVNDVHHVHAWMVDENSVVFSAHVNMADMCLSDVEPVYRKIEKLLKSKYQIAHVTIQAEASRGEGEKLIYDQGRDI